MLTKIEFKMKKLLFITAMVAGPVLYAQQKQISANEHQKDETLKTEQTKATQKKAIRSSDAAINLSEAKVESKKASTKTEAKATRSKGNINARTLKNEAIEN